MRPIADRLHEQQFRFLLTRDLDTAKRYMRERYPDAPLARYGILASSKDKFLPRFGIDNTYQTTKMLREGPWYNSDPRDPPSCCQLKEVATEFASQGLELDFALLAWGSDLRRVDGAWTDDLSRGYRNRVKDRLTLRKNVSGDAHAGAGWDCRVCAACGGVGRDVRVSALESPARGSPASISRSASRADSSRMSAGPCRRPADRPRSDKHEFQERDCGGGRACRG